MGSSKYSFRGWFLRDTAVDSLRKSTYSPRRLHHLFRAGKGPRKRITRKGNTRRLQAVDGGAATPASEGGLRSCLPLGVGPDSGARGLKPTQRREISGRVVDSPSSVCQSGILVLSGAQTRWLMQSRGCSSPVIYLWRSSLLI